MAAHSIPRRTVVKGLAASVALPAAAAFAADPIRIGFSDALTGSGAPFGKSQLLTKQIWAENINKKGGLLGRPVELVHYDDQTLPANVPAIYTKLIDVDKVDILLGAGTNVVAAAMPVVTQHKRFIMSLLALAVNETFQHPRYFQIMPYGPDGKSETSVGFFEAAMTMNPKPQTVAILGADAEYGISMMEGARGHAKRLGLKVVYDRPYPPNQVQFSPILRAVQATNPDIVFVAGYPADSSNLVRAAIEIQLKTRIFGGGMAAWQFAALKKAFGEQLNGLVNYELYVPEPTMKFPGIEDFIAQYRARAGAAAVDPLGHYVPPFVYAGLQVVEQAVTATRSTDDATLADYVHKTTFKTVVGDVRFGADGEWEKGRIIMTQFQNVKGNDLEQFDKPGTQVVLYPPQFKSGDLIYPYPPPKK